MKIIDIEREWGSQTCDAKRSVGSERRSPENIAATLDIRRTRTTTTKIQVLKRHVERKERKKQKAVR